MNARGHVARAAAARCTIEQYGSDQQYAGEHSGHLRGLAAQSQSILQ